MRDARDALAGVLGYGHRWSPDDHGPCVQDPLTHSVIYHQDADGYLWGVKLSEVTMDRDGAAWFSVESCEPKQSGSATLG